MTTFTVALLLPFCDVPCEFGAVACIFWRCSRSCESLCDSFPAIPPPRAAPRHRLGSQRRSHSERRPPGRVRPHGRVRHARRRAARCGGGGARKLRRCAPVQRCCADAEPRGGGVAARAAASRGGAATGARYGASHRARCAALRALYASLGLACAAAAPHAALQGALTRDGAADWAGARSGRWARRGGRPVRCCLVHALYACGASA